MVATGNQRIQIGYGSETIIRVVFDQKTNADLKFETGYVRYDNNNVPVWRPIDPLDHSFDAPWKSGKWQSIYFLRQSQKQGSKTVAYDLDDFEFEGLAIPLPKVTIELTYLFKTYLKEAVGSA